MVRCAAPHALRAFDLGPAALKGALCRDRPSPKPAVGGAQWSGSYMRRRRGTSTEHCGGPPSCPSSTSSPSRFRRSQVTGEAGSAAAWPPTISRPRLVKYNDLHARA